MAKRESDFDFDGPSVKMSKGEDQDDGGASGRSGRVRKKSAKVLEMEEFEQVEKTQLSSKKNKTLKPAQPEDLEVSSDKVKSAKKPKLMKAASGEITPVTSKKTKSNSQSTKALKLTPAAVPDVKVETNFTEVLLDSLKTDIDPSFSQIADASPPDQKSVIKYLLNSPSSANKLSTSANLITHLLPADTPPKKTSKKPKEEKSDVKIKVKKEKTEPPLPETVPAQSLKMKIFASSDPSSAQVTLSTQLKSKKGKKIKVEEQTAQGEAKIQDLDLSPLQSSTKKAVKKVSKKKEKLIQEAISAAKQVPTVTSLVSPPNFPSQGQPISTTKTGKKKKLKSKPEVSLDSSTDELDHSELMDDEEDDIVDDEDEDDDDEEMNLVISETEIKKKKTHTKKKGSKDKLEFSTKSDKGEGKLSKRTPTAYMLFCNSYRPTIVDENPGIEFAAISRKLGEMWQTLSSKQKLLWRRKAQTRRKKSNLISTGKNDKESASSFPLTSTPVSKLPTFTQKAQKSSPEDVPLSPTRLGDQNLSIEPIDVAAHLKLLGESLSIIGMRLMDHKGMIAVQGSLSVLLDSLLCACGPLLCLTQQVPGMDGCSPAVHSQTLDSVAYVMPGL